MARQEYSYPMILNDQAIACSTSKTTKAARRKSTSMSVDGGFDGTFRSIVFFQYVFEVFHLFYSPFAGMQNLTCVVVKKSKSNMINIGIN
ncbi:hypothetical protein O9993_03490 [Vibrio lentus]|nr:hypothetical protein [Vibrio lentus]